MLDLFHDYTSPASAIAAFRCQRLADAGYAVTFVDFEVLGVDTAVPVPLEVLDALDRLADDAAAEGVTLRRPRGLPPTAPAHVAGQVAQASDLGASWRQVCYRAFWGGGADLADHAVLAQLAVEAGVDADAVLDALADPTRLAAFRRGCAAHRAAGIGGVPTIRAQQTLVPGLLPEDDLRALAALR